MSLQPKTYRPHRSPAQIRRETRPESLSRLITLGLLLVAGAIAGMFLLEVLGGK